MNQPFKPLTDGLHHTHQRTPLPTNEMKPPSYGGPQRDAINSIVDGVVSDICIKIGELRHTLDDIEQQVLEGAAGAKHALQDHVQVCIKVTDEIAHTQRVIAEIKTSALLSK